MLIISLLSDKQWDGVRQASPAGAVGMRAADAAAMAAALYEHPSCHAVIDPGLVTPASFATVAAAAANAAASLVLVGELTSRSVDAYLSAAAMQPTDALFGSIVNKDWLRFVLHARADKDVPALVLHHVNVAVTRLPIRIRRSTIALFAGGTIAPTAQVYSEAIGVSRRTIQRWNARVGLAHPACVLSIARLARTWRLLQSTRISVVRAALLVSFPSERTFSRQCGRLARCAPAKIREYSGEEFAGRLARALLSHTAA